MGVPTPLQAQLDAVAVNVRTLRAQRGFTQERLAEAAGMDPRFFQRIERGQVNMRLETLLRLALFFGVTPARLLRKAALANGVGGRPKGQSIVRKGALPGRKAR